MWYFLAVTTLMLFFPLFWKIIKQVCSKVCTNLFKTSSGFVTVLFSELSGLQETSICCLLWFCLIFPLLLLIKFQAWQSRCGKDSSRRKYQLLFCWWKRFVYNFFIFMDQFNVVCLSIELVINELEKHWRTGTQFWSPKGWGTSIYNPYGYVLLWRVWFSGRLVWDRVYDLEWSRMGYNLPGKWPVYKYDVHWNSEVTGMLGYDSSSSAWKIASLW